jgi:ATP-dependent exoDNAse (exonuclease V) beta subunit
MEEILKKLDSYNDPNFKFDARKHKYTLEGEHFISVTQFKERFLPHFDSDYWSKIKAEQAGISQAEMLLEWKKLNDRANIIGTATHNWIENYYNRLYQELPHDMDILDRINKFNIAYGKWLFKLTPIKFEQRIFSRKWKIAGMMDSLFYYNGSVFILDWKTNKEFTHDEHDKGKYESLLLPFDNWFKNHLNEYSIQVSLYKLILREVGIEVKASYLLHIGPNEEAKMYKAHDFSDLLEGYLNEQVKQEEMGN